MISDEHVHPVAENVDRRGVDAEMNSETPAETRRVSRPADDGTRAALMNDRAGEHRAPRGPGRSTLHLGLVEKEMAP